MKLPSLCSVAFALIVAAAVSPATVAAQAPIIIDQLPYTITASGNYVLNRNLNSTQTTGFLISIKANNVTIDLQGHYIAGPSVTTNQYQTPYGINGYELSNVTIQNGTVAFCDTGINLNGNNSTDTNSVGHRIENMRVTRCYQTGIRIDASPGSRITNCQVSQIGYSGAGVPTGIIAIGMGTTVSNNVVCNITGNNTVGIQCYQGSFVRQNTILNCYYGVRDGKYQDNLTYGCTTPFYGGIDAGGNN